MISRNSIKILFMMVILGIFYVELNAMMVLDEEKLLADKYIYYSNRDFSYEADINCEIARLLDKHGSEKEAVALDSARKIRNRIANPKKGLYKCI